MKFKVGDRVKVLNTSNYSWQQKFGVGSIIYIGDDGTIAVEFDIKPESGNWLYYEHDLALASNTWRQKYGI